MVESLKMPEKLWDLANLVTGFAIVQSLTFTYGMAKHDVKMKGPAAHWTAAIGTILFMIGYVVAVVYCGAQGGHLDAKDNADAWWWVTFGRVVAVLGFALITLGTIYVHSKDKV